MPKRMRVVTSADKTSPPARTPQRAVVASDNPRVSRSLTANEIRARLNRRFATTTSLGSLRSAADVLNTGQNQFYSPQLSTDFLEKPQNLRERRAFYRFFYNTNEIVGQAIDIHSTLPLSKLRLVPPKGKNPKQNEYVYNFFETMCQDMKLFRSLIDITHEYFLFGNCVTGESFLRTPGGFKRADQIRQGDYVLTHKGRYKPVFRQFYRDADEVLNIKIWKSHLPLRVTSEHPVEILRGESFEFVPAGELRVGDYVRVTWPQEVEDVSVMPLCGGSDVEKTSTGFKRTITFKRKRRSSGLKVRKKLATWLMSLPEPVIESRVDVASEMGISVRELDNAVIRFNKEIGPEFHERVGSEGFGKGSQVIWYPVTAPIDTSEDYEITKTWEFDSPHEIEINEDFCYLAGFWLGDGTLSRDSSRSPCSDPPGSWYRNAGRVRLHPEGPDTFPLPPAHRKRGSSPGRRRKLPAVCGSSAVFRRRTCQRSAPAAYSW